MTLSIGEVIFDHYAHFLGKPVSSKSYQAKGFDKSVQLLQFLDVFSGCITLSTLGVGRILSSYSKNFIEIVMVVDGFEQEAESLLMKTLFEIFQRQLPIKEGISIGGLRGMPISADDNTIKKAFYFTEPMPFPSEFRFFDSGSRVVLALPITAAEHEFIKTYGGAAFEELLESSALDPFCVARSSVC